MASEVLESHDRGDLATFDVARFDHPATEVEECHEVFVRDLRGLVRVGWDEAKFLGRCVGDMAGWWTGGHQGVAGDLGFFGVVFGVDRTSNEVFAMISTGSLETTEVVRFGHWKWVGTWKQLTRG